MLIVVLIVIAPVILLCYRARKPNIPRALTELVLRELPQVTLSIGGKYIGVDVVHPDLQGGDTTSSAEPGSKALALIDKPFAWTVFRIQGSTQLGYNAILNSEGVYTRFLTGDSSGLYIWDHTMEPTEPSTLNVTLPPQPSCTRPVIGQVYFTDSKTGEKYYIYAPGNFATTAPMSLPWGNITVTYL